MKKMFCGKHSPSLWRLNFLKCHHFDLQYLDMRFGPAIRNIMTITFILSSFFYMPVVMFIPSLSFVTGTRRKETATTADFAFQHHNFFSFFFSDKVESPCGKHSDVLHLRDLYDAWWHSGSRLDRCKVISTK